ncbi:MAG: hypothetical protein HY664_00035 [Chloroflexi bacterium]|nr:hypothetical protein [Chloroflexota bacterium]
MSVLSEALGQRHWELAALCLLLGLGRTLSRIPADSVAGLWGVLGGGQIGKTDK